jgi:hypothetical protein
VVNSHSTSSWPFLLTPVAKKMSEVLPLSQGQKFTPDLHHRVVYIDAAFEIPILAATVSS